MYTTLFAELKKARVTNRMVAKAIGKNAEAVSRKLNGHSDFTVDEARKIKNTFFPELAIDKLFDNEC